MKRKIDYYLVVIVSLFIIIASVPIVFITLKYTSFKFSILSKIEACILCMIMYLGMILCALVSILKLKNKKSKVNKYSALMSALGCVSIPSFVFTLYGKIQEVKKITATTFILSFLLITIFYLICSKYEKREK